MRIQLGIRVLTQSLPPLTLFTQPDTKLCLLSVKTIKQPVMPWSQWVGCLKTLSTVSPVRAVRFLFLTSWQ